MEQIALIYENTHLYWSALIRVLAAGAAVSCFWALYGYKGGKTAAAVVYLPLAVGLSLVLARMAHWYFRPGGYESLEEAMNLLQPGGFALMGAFAGCLLAALLVRILKLTDQLPRLLDCVCIAGSLGIGLGRLGAWFGTSGWGMTVTAEGLYPWVQGVVDPVSGREELRLAVFLLQGAVALILFAGLLLWYLHGKESLRDGDAALIFLLCYGASQVLLDSMRQDTLHLRSNGFLNPVQLLGAGGVLLSVVIFDLVLAATGRWKRGRYALWGMQAACVALAGWMEYDVQRHGSRAALCYGVMAAALAVLVILTLMVRYLPEKDEKKKGQVWMDGQAPAQADQIPE